MGIAHSNDYAKSRNGPKIALGQFWLLKWAACAIDCSPPDHHNVNARIIQFNLLLAFSAMCSTLHFEIKHQDQEPRTQSCANKTCSWGKGVRGSNLSNKEMQSKQGSHPERMLVSDRIGSLLSFLWHWWHTIEIHFTCTDAIQTSALDNLLSRQKHSQTALVWSPTQWSRCECIVGSLYLHPGLCRDF